MILIEKAVINRISYTTGDLIISNELSNLEKEYFRKKLVRTLDSKKFKKLVSRENIDFTKIEYSFSSTSDFLGLVEEFTMKIQAATFGAKMPDRNIIGYSYREDEKRCFAILIEDDKPALLTKTEDNVDICSDGITGNSSSESTEAIVIHVDEGFVEIIEKAYKFEDAKMTYISNILFDTKCERTFDDECEVVKMYLGAFDKTKILDIFLNYVILKVNSETGRLSWKSIINEYFNFRDVPTQRLDSILKFLTEENIKTDQEFVLKEKQLKELEKCKFSNAYNMKIEVQVQDVINEMEILSKLEDILM